MSKKYKRQSRSDLIQYIWAKRKVTDPEKEAELIERYWSRHGTMNPPKKWTRQMTYNLLKNKERLSIKDIELCQGKLGVSWAELAKACGVDPSTLSYYRGKNREIPDKYQPFIIHHLLQEFAKVEGEEPPEKLDLPRPKTRGRSPKKLSTSSINGTSRKIIRDSSESSMNQTDKEVEAMKRLLEVLEPFGPRARRRMLIWVEEKLASQKGRKSMLRILLQKNSKSKKSSAQTSVEGSF